MTSTCTGRLICSWPGDRLTGDDASAVDIRRDIGYWRNKRAEGDPFDTDGLMSLIGH